MLLTCTYSKELSRKRASAVIREDVHVCTYQVPTCSYLVEVSDLR